MTQAIFGSNILHFQQLDSTNKKARELLKEQDLAEGTIIICREQYAGRGYGLNTWESAPDKNITASWILKPHFLAPDKQFLLTKVISLAVKDTVAHFYKGPVSVKVKWPNDVYAGECKIAGILAENNIMGESIRECIAGIGFNINQEVFVSQAPNPVSLKMLAKKEFVLEEVLQFLSSQLQLRYSSLNSTLINQTEKDYHSSLYRLNQPSLFVSQGNTFKGSIRGTDPHGRLIIEEEEGPLRHFDFKEVEFVI